MYICFASQIVVFGLLDMAYLDHFFVLLLCQFNKSNLSISTPNPNECQKYIDYGEDKGYKLRSMKTMTRRRVDGKERINDDDGD